MEDDNLKWLMLLIVGGLLMIVGSITGTVALHYMAVQVASGIIDEEVVHEELFAGVLFHLGPSLGRGLCNLGRFFARGRIRSDCRHSATPPS